MGKKLAIRGHSTRSKEVIELLKMMGGRNEDNMFFGKDLSCIYFIDNYGFIRKVIIENNIHTMRHWQIFTLEEFLEKYPFKVGDLVDRSMDYVSCIIDNMRWNSEKCCVEYHLNYLNGSEYGWHVSDCLIKPENVDAIIGTKIESTGFMQIGKTVSVIFNSANYEDEVELQLGDYEIVVRDGKTYAVLKKPKYPKTYEECCKVLRVSPEFLIKYSVDGTDTERDASLIKKFIKLKRCRDAYWKIAGEEMRLGKPWEPDWCDVKQLKFGIHTVENQIRCITLHVLKNLILVFPTEEMRDAFYENFNKEIEQCKELL